ncbi:MAG: dephospho-CoA kinase [Pseudomonadota bacterium]
MPAPRFSVGLTGGIGCGKSTVTEIFASLGAGIIDTDVIAHELTVPHGDAIPSIVEAFGASFLSCSGAMDRVKMRQHVFANPTERKRLEAILHPLIRDQSLRIAEQVNTSYCIFVIPLLIESGIWHNIVSRVLVVDCPEALQIQRVMTRSNLSDQQVLAIMRAQVSREVRLQAADDIIVNDGAIKALEVEIARLHQMYLQLAKQFDAK